MSVQITEPLYLEALQVVFTRKSFGPSGRECLREVAHNAVNIGEHFRALMCMDVGAATLHGVQDEC